MSVQCQKCSYDAVSGFEPGIFQYEADILTTMAACFMVSHRDVKQWTDHVW